MTQSSSAPPLKSPLSSPLAGFEPAAELSQTRLWSPKSGPNVPPRRWGCGIAPRAFRRVVVPIVAFFVRRLVSIRVEGLENLEGLAGPAIFAATHESKIDAVVLLTALPTRWRYRMAITMGDWVFWQGWFGGRRVQRLRYNALVFAGNVFTLAPNSAGLRGALRHVRFLAADGWSVLVFPEGMHSPWLLPFHAGPGWMAHHTGLPVVPVYIDGMAGILPRDASIARRGAVCIRIGKPIRPDGVDFRTFAQRIEQDVHALRSGTSS